MWEICINWERIINSVCIWPLALAIGILHDLSCQRSVRQNTHNNINVSDFFSLLKKIRFKTGPLLLTLIMVSAEDVHVSLQLKICPLIWAIDVRITYTELVYQFNV